MLHNEDFQNIHDFKVLSGPKNSIIFMKDGYEYSSPLFNENTIKIPCRYRRSNSCGCQLRYNKFTGEFQIVGHNHQPKVFIRGYNIYECIPQFNTSIHVYFKKIVVQMNLFKTS